MTAPSEPEVEALAEALTSAFVEMENTRRDEGKSGSGWGCPPVDQYVRAALPVVMWRLTAHDQRAAREAVDRALAGVEARLRYACTSPGYHRASLRQAIKIIADARARNGATP